jgi:hypothetical protein
MRLVVPLHFSDDDGKENRLLPCGRLPRSVKPRIGRLARTAKGGNDLGGGIWSERFSEGHGQILPPKKKYAMQKIILDKYPQSRHITRMNELLATLSIEQIAEIAAKMFNDTTNEGGLVLDAALAALEEKMEESDFVRFCEKLAA